MQISWINSKDIIEYELRQLVLDGIDVSQLNNEWQKLKMTEPSNSKLDEFKSYLYGKIEDDHNYSLFDKINYDKDFIENISNKKNVDYNLELSNEKLYDKILGGWLGRSSGCLLGKPIEKYSREIIKEILEKSGQWPLKYYMSGEQVPMEIKQKYPWNKHSGEESLLENIECMTEDDDLNYTMLNLKVAEQYPGDISTEKIAQSWIDYMPVMATFTAERVAYKNLLLCIDPYSASRFQNPYREWIGALIRADLWGWISAGKPQLAALRAYNDASLSHLSNGVWGEVFIAVLISLSFVLDDENELIHKSLEFIPDDSHVSKAIKYVIQLTGTENNWDIIVNSIYKNYGHLHWVHVINNVALITAVVLYWKKDFENAVCSTVMAGWDTDSNGATVGSIIGSLIGASRLPAKWIAPLNNNIRSSMRGFDNSKIDDLANRTAEITKINLENE